MATCTPREYALDEVVAQVGDEPIFERDLRLLQQTRPQGSREALLRILIDGKLLAAESRTRGHHRSRTYARRLAWELREHAVNTYQAAIVNERIQIDDDQLRELFERGRYGHEKRIVRAVAGDRAAADELRRQLLAKETSTPDSKDLGFLNRAGAARQGIPPQLFANLAPGAVSPVTAVEQGFAVIRCDGEQTAGFAAYRDELLASARRERFVDEHMAVLEELSATYQLRAAPEGFTLLVAHREQEAPFPELLPDEARTPLFLFRGGHITIADYLDSFRAAGKRPALGDSLRIYLAAWDLVVPKTLVWEAAKAAGHVDSDVVQHWKQRRAEELLILYLRQSRADPSMQSLLDRLRRVRAQEIRTF